MNKLVYGVGVNDLGYRVHVREYITENGGKRIRKTVFLCKYYTVWKSMLERCYSKNTWKDTQPIPALASVVSGYPRKHLKNGWRNKTGVGSA
jgi:hypothetical protein